MEEQNEQENYKQYIMSDEPEEEEDGNYGDGVNE